MVISVWDFRYHGALAIKAGMCGLMGLPSSSRAGAAVPALRASSSAFCLRLRAGQGA